MFHIYVDPLFGDNVKALALNPTNPNEPALAFAAASDPYPNLLPLDRHADATVNPITQTQPIEGYLQHAPYSFRTLSSPNSTMGAVEYAQKLFYQPPSPSGQVPPLPWVHPSGTRSVTHVVIHCLPGLYGPFAGLGDPIDADSGLPWNGEQFPIRLGDPFDLLSLRIPTDRISIQGTSALDTILDARGRPGPILEVNAPDPLIHVQARWHEHAFLDSVTIPGVVSDGQSGTANGAGVHVRGWQSNYFNISNCFIVDNSVGIAIDGDYFSNPPVTLHANHTPRIVNNTVLFNRIGIWLGDIDPASTFPNAHDPVILNNVVATQTSSGGALFPASCFEGVHANDVTVMTVGSPPITFNATFNAWEAANANLGTVIVANFPATSGTALPAPIVDPSQHSFLFIRDVFQASPVGGTGAHYSHHDYRLSPNAGSTAASTQPDILNPLVDRGIGKGPVTMASGQTVVAIGPGVPAGAEEVDLTGWDLDCEGFGNPRLFLRPEFPVPIEGTGMDLGADELGELVVAGFLPHTRIFAPAGIPGTSFSDHLDIYFFDIANTTLHLRPMFNAFVGQDYPWFDHVQNAPDVPSGQPDQFVYGKAGTSRLFLQILSNPVRPRFMRNLECDFSPHLALDAHPLWPTLLGPHYPNPPAIHIGIYGCNPWHAHSADALAQVDNPALFYNKGMSVHGSPISVYLGGQTFVATSTLNPPGTLPFSAPLSQLLIPVQPFLSVGSGGCPSGWATYDADGWGISPCPDRINPPGSYGLAWRLNLEPLMTPRNIQTFLLVPYVSQGSEFTLSSLTASRCSARDLREALRSVVESRR